MVLAMCQGHSQRGFAALRHAGVKWLCEPPQTFPRRSCIADTLIGQPGPISVCPGWHLLFFETPMSLQPEVCGILAKDWLHAAERTEAPQTRELLLKQAV